MVPLSRSLPPLSIRSDQIRSDKSLIPLSVFSGVRGMPPQLARASANDHGRRAAHAAMLLRSAARRAAASSAGHHHAARSQAPPGAKRTAGPAAKVSTRSAILKLKWPLHTTKPPTRKAAGTSAPRRAPSSARMRPQPKAVPAPPTPVAQVQSHRSRQLRSDPDLQRAIAASLEQPSSRKARAEPPAEDGQSQQSRPFRSSRRPLPPPPQLLSVGDAVEAQYGTDEDELWWPA